MDKVLDEKRQYERLSVYCPLDYKAEDDSPKEPSLTINISKGGALLCVERDLSKFLNIILRFRMQNEIIFVLAGIRHSHYDELNNNYEVGVEFFDKPPLFDQLFNAEMDSIKKYRDSRIERSGSGISLAEASIDWYKELGDWPQ